ncbi:hypothetical protein CY0110_17472 [Crocosphaera chwakensis CCY0110]|uniref:Uncharacterized protein n=1 Tax=Crocosphaera chwakensis CCY0110 TaxID=391612 RepID=A3IIH6_9CHRO|nr:hypothetical protein CY0110_17472 [Crocosphaera chwakensis CCY0110]
MKLHRNAGSRRNGDTGITIIVTGEGGLRGPR